MTIHVQDHGLLKTTLEYRDGHYYERSEVNADGRKLWEVEWKREEILIRRKILTGELEADDE